jgi:hypothetical protein
MPPQVPSDAHDASKVEEPVAAAEALGSASQDARDVQTESEVPELCALIVSLRHAYFPPSALRTCAGPYRRQHQKSASTNDVKPTPSPLESLPGYNSRPYR